MTLYQDTVKHLISRTGDYITLHLPTAIWKPVKGSEANNADPDQTPHDVASDQGLQCLLTGFSVKNRIKAII